MRRSPGSITPTRPVWIFVFGSGTVGRLFLCHPRCLSSMLCDLAFSQNLVILCVVLLVPVIPFLLFGDRLEPWIESKLDSSMWESNPFYTGLFCNGLARG